MFTENEVAAILSEGQIQERVTGLKKEFVKEEAKYLEIDDHDFLSLMLVMPCVTIALANKSVSLFEEMALNKKARKLSKGGYFMKKDPVVVAMGFLIKHHDRWQERFYEELRFILNKFYNREEMMQQGQNKMSDEEFCIEGLRAPFFFIRCITSFFMNEEDEDIVRHRKTAQEDYDKVVEVGERLGLSDIPFFKKFLTTFDVK